MKCSKLLKANFVLAFVLVLLLCTEQTAFAETIGSWTKKASMLTPRESFQTQTVNGKIYAMGGKNGGLNYLSSVEEYDPATNRWTAKAPMSASKSESELVAVGGKIYAFGGFVKGADQNEINPLHYSSAVEEYDPVLNTWTAKAPMSTPKFYFQTEVIDGKIYVMGGNDKDSLDTVEEYDPASDTWTTKQSMSSPRAFFNTEVINGKIYAIGGNDSQGRITTVEAYDPQSDTWTEKAAMPTERYSFKTEAVGGKIYVIGGQSYTGSFMAPIEEYDAVSNTWVEKAAMPTERFGFETEVTGGKIYALGGWNGIVKSSAVEAYDPITNTWKTKAPMTATRESFQTEVIDGKIYALGGYDNGYGSSSLEVYDSNQITPATVATNIKGVKLDTGAQLTVKAGKTYQFKLTAATKPTFICGNHSVFKIVAYSSKGNNYYFKVKAVGKAGQAAGFYVNGSRIPSTVGTIR